MANPFTTGPFNCCTCPEPPDYEEGVDDPLATYINLCGCPSVTVDCVSEQKTATLCGYSEFSGNESTPPRKYLIQSVHDKRGAPGVHTPGEGESCGDYYWDGTTVRKYTPTAGGCGSAVITSAPIQKYYQNGTQYVTFNASPFPCYDGQTATVCNWLDPVPCKRVVDTTLSSEDTEADALARATATDGTVCTSIYELRTTSFSFTQRTSTYTATASNLVIGVQYEGCVRIRRREAYNGTVPSGADTAWYDVEPDTIAAFTATATEEEIATDVALPNVQGYEYQVVGAYVWPTSAGCDCPTSYVAP